MVPVYGSLWRHFALNRHKTRYYYGKWTYLVENITFSKFGVIWGELQLKKSIFTKKWSFFALFLVFGHLQRPVDCLCLEDLLRILEGWSNITLKKISGPPRDQKCTFFNKISLNFTKIPQYLKWKFPTILKRYEKTDCGKWKRDN